MVAEQERGQGLGEKYTYEQLPPLSLSSLRPALCGSRGCGAEPLIVGGERPQGHRPAGSSKAHKSRSGMLPLGSPASRVFRSDLGMPVSHPVTGDRRVERAHSSSVSLVRYELHGEKHGEKSTLSGLISTCFPCKTVADSYWKPICGSICCCFFPFLRGIRSLVYDNSLTRF